MSPTARSEFRNTRNYYIGVMTRREDNKMKSLAIPPEGTIWLDEEEQIATANAPRQDQDNPFINGDLELLTPATVVANRRPLGFSEHANPDEVSNAAPPEPPAPEESDPAGGPGGDAGGTPEGALAPEEGQPEGSGSGELPKPPEQPQGARNPSKEDAEKNAREAAARRRAPAPNELTGAPPETTGKAPEGKRAPAEEVATPEAVGKTEAPPTK